MKPRRFAVTAIITCLVAGSAARAAPPAAPPPELSTEARAEQLFRSGEKKFDSGAHEAACADFEESLKLGPKLGTLLNVALCHETVGKLATAWQEFHHASAWAAQNNQRDRLDFAVQHIRGLESRLPRVVLHLPADRAIAAIDLDGDPLPEQRWYLPLYLDPGEHTLAVTAPGKKRTTIAFSVTTSPTDQIVAVPSLADADAPPPPRPPPPAPTGGADETIGFVLLGVGAAGLGAGTVFGVLAMTGDAGDASVKDHATVSTIAFVAGAALAAGGGALLIRAANRAARVGVVPRPGGGVLGFATTF